MSTTGMASLISKQNPNHYIWRLFSSNIYFQVYYYSNEYFGNSRTAYSVGSNGLQK